MPVSATSTTAVSPGSATRDPASAAAPSMVVSGPASTWVRSTTGAAVAIGSGSGRGRSSALAIERDGQLAGVGPVGGSGSPTRASGFWSAPSVVRHLDGLAHARHQRGDGGVGGERHRAGDGFDQHQPERVHVGLAVDRLPLGLLGGRVPGRAEHRALRLGPGRLGEGASQAEVGDAQAAVLAEEEVGRLHVAVHEAAAVGVVEAPRDLQPDEEHLRQAEPHPLVEDSPQAAAAEVLGDDVRGAVVVAPVVDGDDVGVVQGRGRLRLGTEAPKERCRRRRGQRAGSSPPPDAAGARRQPGTPALTRPCRRGR